MNRALAIRQELNRAPIGRGRYSLTFEEAGGRRRLVQSITPLHYSDGGVMREIDTAWLSEASGRFKVASHSFQARATANFRPAEIVELSIGDKLLGFRPLPLFYANAGSDPLNASTMQIIASPQVVKGELQGDLLRWPGAYGAGTTLEWRATATGLAKWLQLESPALLPPPRISGPRELLIPFAMRSSGLNPRAFIGENPDDLKVTGRPLLLDGADGDAVFAFDQPVAVDAAGEAVTGRLRWRRVGNSIVAAASFPLSWLVDPARVYPVRLDPSITQNATDVLDQRTSKEGGGMFEGTSMFVGTLNASNVDWRMAIRWAGLDIPQGATIDSAVETFLMGGFTDTANKPLIEMFCEASDDAARITTNSELYGGRPWTTAKADWQTTTGGSRQPTADFKAALQEVVNRPGWVRLAAIQVYHKDIHGNAAPAPNRVSIRRSDYSVDAPPTLDVTYTEAVAPPPASEITVTLRPQVDADDGYTYDDGVNGGFNMGAAFLVVNDINASNFDHLTFALLTLDAGQVLPQGASLKEAHLILTARGGASSAHETKVAFQQADNPTAPGSRSAVLSAQTAAGTRVTWAPTGVGWNAGSEYAIDVTALVQAIVNRAGYSSGRMLALWEYIQAGWNGGNNNYQAHSYASSPALAPRLVVTFYDPDPPKVAGEVTLI